MQSPARHIYMPKKKPFIPRTKEELDWWLSTQRQQSRYQDRREFNDSGLIFDMKFDELSLADEVSGATASFERGSNATYERDKLLLIGEDRARLNSDGLLLEGAGVNKCTCYKYNPVDTTNVAASTSTVTVVDETASLNDSTFKNFAGNVFNISAAGNGEDTSVGGTTANTNKHSVSVVARVLSGSAVLRLGSLGSTAITSEWSRVISEDITPGSTSDLLRIRSTSANTVVQFILPQLEEGERATTPIVGANTTASASRATEAADASDNGFSIPLDDIPEVKAALQSEGTMVLDCKIGFDQGDYTNTGVITSRTNGASVLFLGGTGLFSSTDGSTFPSNGSGYSADDDINAVVRWSASGYNVSINGVIPGLTPFDGSFALGDNLALHWGNEGVIEYARLRFYNRSLTDEEIVNV